MDEAGSATILVRLTTAAAAAASRGRKTSDSSDDVAKREIDNHRRAARGLASRHAPIGGERGAE
jgi:hypothetical protein